MAKSKLHPLAKKAGFKSNEEFYKLYPTKEHYEMAMGGVPKVFPQIQSEKGFFSPGFENVPAPYQNGSFQTGGPFIGARYPGMDRDSLYADVLTQEYPDRSSELLAQFLKEKDKKKRNSLVTGWSAALDRAEKKNQWITNPDGSITQKKLGGYAGFGEGHPFPYQPGMPKNGEEAYGRPTYGSKWIAQDGGNYYDQDLGQMMGQGYPKAHSPQSGANYQWPMSPNAPASNIYATPTPGGMYDVTPRYSNQPGQITPPIVDRIPPTGKMGGTPCYNCGGYKKKKGGQADFNQGPEYFTNKLNQFTEHLRNTALSATEQEMQNQFMAQGGTPEMFPYAMPYQAKTGGSKNWIQKAVNPKHKGYCTPMTKPTCTPRRKALARTFKKHHGFHKQEGGEQDQTMQLIQAYAEKVGIDPEQIMQKLQQMSPEEQQQTIAQIQQELGGVEQEGYSEDQVEGGMEEEEVMAMGGSRFYQTGGSNPWLAKGYTAVYTGAPVPSSYYLPGHGADTPNPQMINPHDLQEPVSGKTSPQSGSYPQIYDPKIQQKIAERSGAGSWSEYLAGPKADTATKAKFAGYSGPTWGSPAISAPVAQVSSMPFKQTGGTPQYQTAGAVPATPTTTTAPPVSWSYDQFKEYMDKYKQAQGQQDPTQGPRYSEGYAGYDRYMQPSYGGMGYFPSNMSPSIKFKNVKTYINGLPGGYGSTPHAANADVYNKFKQFYGDDTVWGKMSVKPRLFGKRYDWEYGVNTPRPSDDSTGERSWVGQRLHDIGPNIDKYKTPFPSKKRKAEYEEDQAWKAGKSARDAKYTAQQAEEEAKKNALLNYQNAALSQQPTPGPQYQGAFGSEGYPSLYTAPPVPPAFVTSSQNPAAPNLQDYINTNVRPFHRDPAFLASDPNNQAAIDDSIRRGRIEQQHQYLDSEFPGYNPNGMKYGGNPKLGYPSYQMGGQYDLTEDEIQKLIDGGYEFDYLD